MIGDMNHPCPNCKRELYNRRQTHCGYCGAEIPKELRFTPEEIAAQDNALAQLEQKRKERHRAEDKAAEERAAQRRREELRMLFHLPL